MRRGILWTAALAVALLAGAAAVRAEEDEVEVDVRDLPAAVVEALRDKIPEADLIEAEKESEDGETLYEVEIEVDGKELEVEVTAGGEIVEVETEDD